MADHQERQPFLERAHLEHRSIDGGFPRKLTVWCLIDAHAVVYVKIYARHLRSPKLSKPLLIFSSFILFVNIINNLRGGIAPSIRLASSSILGYVENDLWERAMMRSALHWAFWVTAITLIAPARASTVLAPELSRHGIFDDYSSPAPTPAPWEQVEEAVGTVSYEIGCPEVRTNLDPVQGIDFAVRQRTVAITLGKVGTSYRDPSILTAILGRAVDEARLQCKLTYGLYSPAEVKSVGSTTILGRPSEGASVETLAQSDGYDSWGYWKTIVDVYADEEVKRQEENEARDRAMAAAAQEQAEQEARRVAQHQAEQQRAIAQARQEDESREAAARFRSIFTWVLVIGCLACLFSYRERLLTVWYGLQPHPAKRMVDDALYRGVEIDGALYDAVHEPPIGNEIQSRVQMRQANELTDRLRAHQAQLAAEEAQRLATIKEGVERENAFRAAHAALLRAGIDHEVAAARIAELRRATRT